MPDERKATAIPHHDLRVCVGAAIAPSERFNPAERGVSSSGEQAVTDGLGQEVQALHDKLEGGVNHSS